MFVYVLKSEKDNNLYYGITEDIEKRLGEHNKGLVKSTKSRAPFSIVYHEKVGNITQARKREKYFKSGFGRKYVKNQINKMALSSNG